MGIPIAHYDTKPDSDTITVTPPLANTGCSS